MSSKSKSPANAIVATLYDPDEEWGVFHDLVLARLLTTWREAVFLQRLTRSLSQNELLEILLECAATFAATATVDIVDVSREEFLSAMGEAFDNALEAEAERERLAQEEEEEEEEDEEEPSVHPIVPTVRKVIDDALANPEPDPENGGPLP